MFFLHSVSQIESLQFVDLATFPEPSSGPCQNYSDFL